MRKEEKILLIGAMFWWLGEGLFGPLFAVFTGQIGGDLLDITWAWAIYLIVTGFLVMYVGRISDRVGHARLMVVGFVLNAILTFCYLLIDSPMELFLVQAGLGVALALAEPTWDALYAKFEDRSHAGYTWGLSNGTEELITGMAILIGGFIVSWYGFKTLFIIMGIIQTIGAIYQAKILHSSK